MASFDREIKNEYYITVIAEDGAPSNRSNHHPPGTPNKGLTHAYYGWLTRGQICNGCHRQFIIQCPSCGHISKTKQDRPIVTMEHC